MGAVGTWTRRAKSDPMSAEAWGGEGILKGPGKNLRRKSRAGERKWGACANE